MTAALGIHHSLLLYLIIFLVFNFHQSTSFNINSKQGQFKFLENSNTNPASLMKWSNLQHLRTGTRSEKLFFYGESNK